MEGGLKIFWVCTLVLVDIAMAEEFCLSSDTRTKCNEDSKHTLLGNKADGNKRSIEKRDFAPLHVIVGTSIVPSILHASI